MPRYDVFPRARRVQTLLRIAAYACGAAGALLIYAARRMNNSAEAAAAVFGWGWALLVGMFLLFTASHVFYLYHKFFRSTPRSEATDNRP